MSSNKNAIHIFKKNQDKINLDYFSSNINIFEIDLKFLKQRMDVIREELMIKLYHPQRFKKYLTMGYDIADDTYIII